MTPSHTKALLVFKCRDYSRMHLNQETKKESKPERKKTRKKHSHTHPKALLVFHGQALCAFHLKWQKATSLSVEVLCHLLAPPAVLGMGLPPADGLVVLGGNRGDGQLRGTVMALAGARHLVLLPLALLGLHVLRLGGPDGGWGEATDQEVNDWWMGQRFFSFY